MSRAALLALLLTGLSCTKAELAPEPSEPSEPAALPGLRAPGDGPRSPSRRGLGFHVGVTRLPDVEAVAAARGWSCRDTSVRAMLAHRRAQKTDALSGASPESPREANPQVRLSCEETPAESLGDRVRQPGTGRLLLIFDSPTHPLRHVSLRARYRDAGVVLKRLESGRRAVEGAVGLPTTTQGAAGPLAAWGNRGFEWEYADFGAKVMVTGLGSAWSLIEAYEVPWPVRVTPTGD